jgi:hypothetical protein
MTLSKIVIEAEGTAESGTMLRLIIDTHLIAKSLTMAQKKFLVGEILDRTAALEEEKAPESSEGQFH